MPFSLFANLIQKIPVSERHKIRRTLQPAWFGAMRRISPLSQTWGYDRGLPIDRYYIEQFLDQHRKDICGRVLEIRDSEYSDRFGNGFIQKEVLDINPANPKATFLPTWPRRSPSLQIGSTASC